MRKLILSLTLIFTLLLVGCGNNKNVDSLADGVLTVGMECGYAPFNYSTLSETENGFLLSDGSYCDGYDVKIARTLANELGVDIEIKAIEWEGLVESLQTNKIDAIIAGMSPTAERKQTISFTDVYYRSEQVVVVNEAGNFADALTLSDFSGAKISAQLGTLQEGLVDQLVGAIPHTSLDSYPTLVTALKSNVIDGFIAELPVALQIAKNNPNLKVIRLTDGFTISDELVSTAIGLRKRDTDLLNKLNAALAKITDETRNTWMNEFVDLSSESEE